MPHNVVADRPDGGQPAARPLRRTSGRRLAADQKSPVGVENASSGACRTAAAERQRRRERKRRWKRRQAAGRIVVPVELGEAIITGLVANEWLLEKDSVDARRIGAAIADLLADSFKSS